MRVLNVFLATVINIIHASSYSEMRACHAGLNAQSKELIVDLYIATKKKFSSPCVEGMITKARARAAALVTKYRIWAASSSESDTLQFYISRDPSCGQLQVRYSSATPIFQTATHAYATALVDA